MTGALSFIYPVVAIIVDRIAFGQTLAWIQVLGAVLILLAAAGVNLGWRIVPQKTRAVCLNAGRFPVSAEAADATAQMLRIANEPRLFISAD